MKKLYPRGVNKKFTETEDRKLHYVVLQQKETRVLYNLRYAETYGFHYWASNSKLPSTFKTKKEAKNAYDLCHSKELYKPLYKTITITIARIDRD